MITYVAIGDIFDNSTDGDVWHDASLDPSVHCGGWR